MIDLPEKIKNKEPRGVFLPILSVESIAKWGINQKQSDIWWWWVWDVQEGKGVRMSFFSPSPLLFLPSAFPIPLSLSFPSQNPKKKRPGWLKERPKDRTVAMSSDNFASKKKRKKNNKTDAKTLMEGEVVIGSAAHLISPSRSRHPPSPYYSCSFS